ncbi:MAG: prolipoprotein diacylglyceryl transferase [Clostridia bacterium]|nr:prolipoprotein diacylglyceryl transferase [Clostridia bacterium]
MDYNAVSFPGFGIGEFKINPTVFSIIPGKLTIEWYALIICVGLVVTYIVCDLLTDRFDVSKDDLLDVLLFGLPAGFIGARIWYILGDLESFDSFLEMISVWNGGLAIYGGIFGGCLAGYFVCRYKKVSFLNMLDLSAIGFMVGQIIGRWGNFANVEVFGIETDLPWRMGVNIMNDAGIALNEWTYVHPLFLYESLWNLIGLLLIFAYMDSRKFKGELFLLYTAWYGIGRAWMEPLRDTTYNLHIFGIRVNMVLAIAIAVFAIAALIVLYIRKPARFVRVKKEPESIEAAYEKQFSYAVDEQELNEEEEDQKDG